MGQARSEIGGGGGNLLLVSRQQHAGYCIQVLSLEVSSDAVERLAVNDCMDMLQGQEHWDVKNPPNPEELGFTQPRGARVSPTLSKMNL